MYNRLIPFLEHSKTLLNFQKSFRKSRIIEFILNARDSKNHSVGLFSDLSKAFGMVSHEILIDKLQCLLIRELAKG